MNKTALKIIISFLFCFIIAGCSNDDDNITNVLKPAGKTPRYNNGIFVTNRGITAISSKINFVSFKDNNVQEIYSSATNHTVAIDGDDSYYYLLNNKIDDQGASSILVKDVENFEDVVTITENLEGPIKVISHKNKIFIINSNRESLFNPKPSVLVLSKNNNFAFNRKINLPEKTRIDAVKVHNNKAYIVLSPANLGEFKESIFVLNLEDYSTNNLTLSNHKRYDIQDINLFNDNVYLSLSPGLSILSLTRREIYKLSDNNFELTYKINDENFSVDPCRIRSFNDNLYASVSKKIYKNNGNNSVLESVFDNNERIEFIYFSSDKTFFVISNGKLKYRNINDKSIKTNLVDVSTLYTTTVFSE